MAAFYSIRIDDIPHDGFRLATQWDAAALEEILEGSGKSFRIAAPLDLEIQFHLPGSQVILEGYLKTDLEIACVRCLKGFFLPLEVRFRYVFWPTSKEAPVEEKELSENELEVQYYTQGEPIDLRPLIAEQIYLYMPQYPHCAESCRGLCAKCGANLNEAPCSCTDGFTTGDASPFSVLKKLKKPRS
jgi:uncharacterized protein